MGCVVDGGGSPLFSLTPVNDGAWHHIVLTHDSGVQKIYVDGLFEDMSTQEFVAGAYHHSFGTRPFSGHYEGSLDDIRIYNCAITADEVTQLYNMGR